MKNLITSIALLAATTVFSQTYYPDTAHFEDGTAIPFFVYNMNDNPPKYNTLIAPVSPFIGDAPAFCFSVAEFYRLNDKIVLDGRITSAYGKTDAGISKNNKRQKPYLDLYATFNYKFGSITRNYKRQRHIALYSKSSAKTGVDYEVYQVKFDAQSKTNFYATGGLDFTRTAGNVALAYTDSSFIDYSVGNMSSFSIVAGITRERYHYVIYESPFTGKTRCYNYRVRNYLLFSYAPVANYTVYAADQSVEFGDPNSGSYLPDDYYKEVTNGYTEPTDIKNIGWKFGAELKAATTPSLFFGTEFGQLPRLRGATSNYNVGYLILRVGMEIPSKLEPPKKKKK